MKKHNRHLLRQLGVVLVTAAMMLSIAACGQGSTFDASGYVDATMKTVTTGDTSALDAYSKEAVTDLADTYADELQDVLESMAGDTELSKDVQEKYKELLTLLMGAISYSVGEAKELTEGSVPGYEVPLTIKPLQLNVQDKLTEWVNTLETDEKALNDMNALYEKLYGEVAELLKNAIAEGKYGEEKTFIINVTKNKDGLYEINEDDMEKAMESSFTTDLDTLS